METLNEIVRDLERMAQTLDCVKSADEWADGPSDISDIYRSVARRILSVIGVSDAKVKEVVSEQGKDNVRLRAALKPVLGIVIPPDEDVDSHDGCECRWCYSGDKECWRGKGMNVMDAVRDAQRIYNGSGESEVKE